MYDQEIRARRHVYSTYTYVCRLTRVSVYFRNNRADMEKCPFVLLTTIVKGKITKIAASLIHANIVLMSREVYPTTEISREYGIRVGPITPITPMTSPIV